MTVLRLPDFAGAPHTARPSRAPGAAPRDFEDRSAPPRHRGRRRALTSYRPRSVDGSMGRGISGVLYRRASGLGVGMIATRWYCGHRCDGRRARGSMLPLLALFAMRV
jgi:hypothetical protein